MLGKLPNRNHRAQNTERINRGFQEIAPFFFRAHQERVSSFLLHIVAIQDAAEAFFRLKTAR